MRKLLAFVCFLFAAALVACAADGAREASSSSADTTYAGPGVVHGVADTCATGVTAFRTDFLANVQNEVCKNCHNGANPNAPPWLVGQDEQIYLSVKNYVNFADVTSSRIYIRAGNRHCGSGCNPEMAARMKGYLESWWADGESTCEQSTQIRTAPQRIPADLPKDRFVKMSWELSSVDVALRGARLEVEIRKFTDAEGPTPGSYFIRKPRVVSTRPFNIAIAKLRVLNNRAFQEAANQFERVNAVVSADTAGGEYPVLSPEPLILVEDHPGADELMLSFEKITKTNDRRACRAMDKFNSEVMPIVEARACKSCHTAGSSTHFDMTGTNDDVCAKFLGRTWPNPDVLPALVQYPLNGRFEHPRVFVGPDNVLPDWNDWIQAEWQ